MTAKRLTRKEIVKEDPIKKSLKDFSYWALENSKFLVGVGVAIVLICVGFFAWQSYSASRNEEMQAEFASALDTFHASVQPETSEEATPVEEEPTAENAAETESESATTEDEVAPEESETAETTPEPEFRFKTDELRYQAAVEEFQSLADKYSGSYIGQLSRYYVGLSLIELGREDEAREDLQSLVAEADRLDTKNLARNALSQLLAGEGNYAEAADYLQQIIDNPSTKFPEQVALMRLASFEENSGDLQRALEIYRDVESRFAGSTFSNQAQAEISRLELLVEEPADSTMEETPEVAEETTSEES